MANLTTETPHTVDDLALKPCHITCPICKQDGTTKVVVPDNKGAIAFIAAITLLTCCWCLPCMATLPRWAIHFCSHCGVTLGMFEVRSSYDDTRRELAEYVKHATDANRNANHRAEDEEESLPVYTIKAEPIVYAAPRPTALTSPLGPFSDTISEKGSPADKAKQLISVKATGTRVGDWTVTSSDPTVKYKVTVNSFSDWEESTTTQADWDRNPQILGPTTFCVTRATSDGVALSVVNGAIDTRAGSWSTGITSGTHTFSFGKPASDWQLTTTEGTLFWERGGWSRILVDAYRRPCAWLKGTWSKKLTLDPRLSPAVVDEIVAIAVAMVIQQQRSDVWTNAHSG